MKFTEQVVYEVTWTDLEDLMKEFFSDPDFDLHHEIDASNGTYFRFMVFETNSLHDIHLSEARQRYKSKNNLLYIFGVEAVLEYYAREGRIPFGVYVTHPCW